MPKSVTTTARRSAYATFLSGAGKERPDHDNDADAMTDSGSILIITNPTSNAGRGARTAGLVAAELRTMGADVIVRETTQAGDAKRITGEALDDPNLQWRCIAACGGDGTIQQVAGVLARARSRGSTTLPSLGVIPAGRCNDFAHALGIPKDPHRAATVLVEGTPTPIDLGRVNDRYFCTVATVGIDAEVSSYVDSIGGRLKGTVAYLLGALRVLRRYEAKTVRLEGDFGKIEQSILLASSANTRLYGGAIPIAPDADPTDGQLDLCVIDAVSKLAALRLIPSILASRHPSRREVRIIRTKQFKIDAAEPMEIWADGERIGSTPATIEIVPAALLVQVPPNGPITAAPDQRS